MSATREMIDEKIKTISEMSGLELMYHGNIVYDITYGSFAKYAYGTTNEICGQLDAITNHLHSVDLLKRPPITN